MRRPPNMEVFRVSTSESRESGIQLTRQQLLAAGAAGGLALAAWGPGGAVAFAATERSGIRGSVPLRRGP
jgi:hypothetical protein